MQPGEMSMDQIERRRMITAGVMPLFFTLLLWMVFALEHTYGWDLARFGILPRTLSGLPGVLFTPFLHGDLDHLWGNTLSVMVLGWCLVYFYPKVAWRVVMITWLAGGFWVWASARQNYHIGSSGVIYGMAAFLFFSGVVRKQRTLMAISLIVVFLYGSMVWGIFPLVPRMSWESHLAGGLLGAILAWWYRSVAPAHIPPEVEFDDDPDEMPARPPRPRGQWTVVYHLGEETPAPEGTSRWSYHANEKHPWQGEGPVDHTLD